MLQKEMSKSPTLLGKIEDVDGNSVGVVLNERIGSGLVFVKGKGYRIGQIGNFIKIPLGFTHLFGIITKVGASALPQNQHEIEYYQQRWIRVELIGEGFQNGDFSRGISQYPTIGDAVHLVTEDDLKKIYGRPDSPVYIKIGHLSGTESIPTLLNINFLVTRHSVIVGTTGTGKSTTVASILNKITDKDRFSSARVIVLDIHGEYANVLRDYAKVFTINSSSEKDSDSLFIPYWALRFEEIEKIAFGNLSDEAGRGAIIEKIIEKKKESLSEKKCDGVDENNLNVDTPVPFSIHSLWLEMFKLISATHITTQNQSIDTVAYSKDENDEIIQPGNASEVIPPKYESLVPKKVFLSRSTFNIKRNLEVLAYRLRDARYRFLFNPGNWCPNEKGVPKEDIDSLLESWLGHKENITILDLSGIPREILDVLIGALLRIIYDSLFWSKNLPEGGRERPLLLVLEEAHVYLRNESKLASEMVRKIVKEGRKYGVGAMIVSQRPSEIDSTILSQCGTIFAMRLANKKDRGQIYNTASDNLKGLFSLLPVLKTGEAIIVGEAVHLPIRSQIDLPPNNRKPDSEDPLVYGNIYRPGGWNKNQEKYNYKDVIKCWRSQDPTSPNLKKKKRERGEKE